jgi:soluble lytic murein transglycosylase-like protein
VSTVRRAAPHHRRHHVHASKATAAPAKKKGGPKAWSKAGVARPQDTFRAAPSRAVSASPSAKVSAWISEAQVALRAAGVPDGKMDPRAIALIIQHESSGNPTAVNHWDSNARAGHPSIGVMQVIQPTFNAYKLPGHDDIRNPVDNIIAGVRYAVAQYGSVSNVPGVRDLARGRGYVGY